jgi:hypothetical protein
MTRADVRGALIALALLVYGALALPIQRSVRRSSFDTPVAREELARWTDLLARVGVHRSVGELADDLVDVGNAVGGVKATLTAPLKPWTRLTGTGQAWGLFTYPDTFPHRLVIEGRTGDTWRTLYAGLDPDATFLRDILTYRRVRGVYDGNTVKPGDSWNNFAAWAAKRVFESHPDVVEVHVLFHRFHTTPPDGPADPKVVPRHLRTFQRDAN